MLILAALALALAAALPQFDAASIRFNRSLSHNGSLSREGGRITLDNFSLRDTILFAYGIPTGREDRLTGPAWIDETNFDIVATFPINTSRDDVRLMLQSLLASRFGLTAHHETKTVRGYDLVVAKSGAKLKPHPEPSDGGFTFGPGHLRGDVVSIASLADRLSGSRFALDRPVVDRKGITGAYDFELRWGPDDATGEVSIFTALEEQPGLKLMPAEHPVQVLVIDRINKEPTVN